MSDLEGTCRTTRIVEPSPDHGLLVVDDVVANATFLVFGARVFDISGAVRDELPVARTTRERANSILESVLAHREGG